MTSNTDRQDTRGKLCRTPKGSATRPDTGFSGPQRGFYSDVATLGASEKLGVSFVTLSNNDPVRIVTLI